MLTRIWHKPLLYPEPVMRPEMPWEGTSLSFYGTVLRIGEAWRMYYTTASPDFRAAMCVADSTDGFHWTRPELGIHEFRGSKRNNIVLTHCRCVSVYYDADDEEYPFRTMVHRGPSKTGHPVYGMYEAVSKDGYHWTEGAVHREPSLQRGHGRRDDSLARRQEHAGARGSRGPSGHLHARRSPLQLPQHSGADLRRMNGLLRALPGESVTGLLHKALETTVQAD